VTTRDLPTDSDVRAAAERIRPYIRRTPSLRAEMGGRPVVFKLEHPQRTGSFKLRRTGRFSGGLGRLVGAGRNHRSVKPSGR
jgi:threonine dehydratase